MLRLFLICMNNTKQIFVVGSGRCGTTMMGRVLNNHKDIFTFEEIHFLGWLCSKHEINSLIDRQDAIRLLSKLFAIQQDGIFLKKNPKQFNKRSEAVLSDVAKLTSIEVYKRFLQTITNENGCSITCEQTPRNIFYIQELLSHFPNAKIIHMVRDSRDVLLSQKNKWKRGFLGANKIPLRETIRSYMNYHPITFAKFWSSAVLHGNKMEENPRVIKIKFEELLQNPQDKIMELCSFIGIPFNKKMLEVPNIGSSISLDKEDELEIDSTKIEKWKRGGLTAAEIYLSQIFTKDRMQANGYELKSFLTPPILSIFYLIILPIKVFFTLILNFKRIGSITEFVQQRIITR